MRFAIYNFKKILRNKFIALLLMSEKCNKQLQTSMLALTYY